MSGPNAVAAITNNLGYDVDIYDVFNPNANASTPGLLTYTKLATVLNGKTAQVQTIHFASQLQAMRTGNIVALNNNYYQQFPVAVMGISTLGGPTAFTLTSAMQQGMEQSFQFIKYSQANPTSQLATNFRTALGDPKSQEDAVNTFFLSTSSFKQCTLSTWIAVFSWQSQFTNAWQGTFYLYSLGSGSSSGSSTTGSNGSTTGSTGSTTGSSAPALVATLAIISSADANSAVLTMASAGNQSTPVAMAGDGTMQEQNPGTGSLSVVLTPVWLNIIQTSQQNGTTATSYVIAAAFTGTINGVQVAGNLNQLAIPSPSDTSSSSVAKTLANSFSIGSFFQLAGLLTSVAMVYYMAKGHKLAETQKIDDAQSKPDAKGKTAQIQNSYQKDNVSLVNAEAKKVEGNAVTKTPAAYNKLRQAANIENAQTVVEAQTMKIGQVLGDSPPSDATESLASNLLNAANKLKEAADPNLGSADRATALKDVSTSLTTVSTQLDTVLTAQSSKLSSEAQTTLSNAKESVDALQEQVKATQEIEAKQAEAMKDNPDKPVNENNFKDAVKEDGGY